MLKTQQMNNDPNVYASQGIFLKNEYLLSASKNNPATNTLPNEISAITARHWHQECAWSLEIYNDWLSEGKHS